MDNKTAGQIFGGVLILIAIIIAVLQHFGIYNFYGEPSNKWYFYGLAGVIGLIGILIVGWSYTKKQTKPTAGQSSTSQG